jgi:hypothetical protein
MTIKKLKPVKTTEAASGGTAQTAPATGGATIADRFKLDLPDPSAEKVRAVGKKAAAAALVVGLIALGVAGILTFTLFKHWEFLKGA